MVAVAAAVAVGEEADKPDQNTKTIMEGEEMAGNRLADSPLTNQGVN